jgi:protein SCO1/2
VNPRTLLALFLAGIFALGVVVVAATSGDGESDETPADEPAGALLPDGVRAPDFELTDEREDPVSMRELRGSPVIVTFLYTNCEDTCPPAAQQVKGALNELGHDVPALAIAVDPPNDTADSARAFLSEARMLGRMRFVLGSREELEPVWRGFAIRAQSAREEHQARIVLIDREGFQRIGFPLSQATPERIAHDVRLLEAE